MSVWAMALPDGFESAVASAVALSTGGVAAWAVARTARRSTDEAEIRYRLALEGSSHEGLKALESAARAMRELEALEEQTHEDASSRPRETSADVAIAVDDVQRRMAMLPIDYHAQVLAQSRASFSFSIGAAVVGFVVLIVAIALMLAGFVAPGVAGLVGTGIVEAVAGLFFLQSNRARVLVNGQLEGFREADEIARQAHERRELIGLVKDDANRDQLIAETVLKLAEGQPLKALPPGAPASK